MTDDSVNGEYYCSLLYNLLYSEGYSISIYPIHFFMQWGTPQDLKEYNNWSSVFQKTTNNLINPSATGHHINNLDALITIAGSGARFVQQGYALPKPLLPILETPMFLQARRSLPATDHTYITTTSAIASDPKFTHSIQASNYQVHTLPSTPLGQALTLLSSLDSINTPHPLLLSSCDHSIQYSIEQLDQTLSYDYDLIVFTDSDYIPSKRNPCAYGWVDINPSDNTVLDLIVKEEPINFLNPSVVIGTFIFKDKDYLRSTINQLIESHSTVNGEYYVDSLIKIYKDQGKTVKAFPVDSFICWGTPDEFNTFNYWNKAFSLYPEHPYTSA